MYAIFESLIQLVKEIDMTNIDRIQLLFLSFSHLSSMFGFGLYEWQSAGFEDELTPTIKNLHSDWQIIQSVFFADADQHSEYQTSMTYDHSEGGDTVYVGTVMLDDIVISVTLVVTPDEEFTVIFG